MESIVEGIRFCALSLGILFTLVNIVRTLRGHNLPAMNFIYQTIGITVFIWLTWCR